MARLPPNARLTTGHVRLQRHGCLRRDVPSRSAVLFAQSERLCMHRGRRRLAVLRLQRGARLRRSMPGRSGLHGPRTYCLRMLPDGRRRRLTGSTDIVTLSHSTSYQVRALRGPRSLVMRPFLSIMTLPPTKSSYAANASDADVPKYT